MMFHDPMIGVEEYISDLMMTMTMMMMSSLNLTINHLLVRSS